MNLGEATLRILEQEIGNGEEGANNAGFHINKYRQGRDVHGPWCARFIYWGLLQASWATGRRRCIVRATGSARKLAARIASKGRYIGSIEWAQPGDILLWERHGGMHINIFAEWTQPLIDIDSKYYNTLDGNKGHFPAVVRTHNHKVSEWSPAPTSVIRLPELK